MRPHAMKQPVPGPTVVRALGSSTRLYRQVVQDVRDTIRDAILEAQIGGDQYAALNLDRSVSGPREV
jgi:GMP synthase PP-ATPase subunit